MTRCLFEALTLVADYGTNDSRSMNTFDFLGFTSLPEHACNVLPPFFKKLWSAPKAGRYQRDQGPFVKAPWQRAWKLVHSGCLLPSPCSRAVHRRNVNNKDFGVCFHYIKLNPIIIGSDLVILDLESFIFGSNIVFINVPCYNNG